MIDHLNAYVVLVRDMEESVSFYRDKLGFKLEYRNGNDFASFVYSNKGGPVLALASIDGASKVISETAVRPNEIVPPRSYFAIFVEDVDKEYEELKAKGIRFVRPPTTFPWNQRIAYFEDPDGHLWEISHFLKK